MSVSLVFGVDEQSLSDIYARLGREGFSIVAAEPNEFVLLDTFDGRLHAAGFRLEASGPGERQLALLSNRTSPAFTTVDGPLKCAADLPEGPFRERLDNLIDARALRRMMQVASLQTHLVRVDEDGNTIVGVIVHEHLSVDGRQLESIHSLLEIASVLGRKKRVSEVARHMTKVGAKLLGDNVSAVAAAAAGIDLAGFSNSPVVLLDPAMPALDGVRVVFRRLLVIIDGNWQGTIDRSDSEFLHDLRIAVRRTRSVLNQGKSILPTTVLERAKSGFGLLGELTGPPRDLDVYLLEWPQYTADMSGDERDALEPVRKAIEQRRDSAYMVLASAMRSPELGTMMDEWRAWLAEPIEEIPASYRPLCKFVVKRVGRAHEAVLQRGRQILPTSPAEDLHGLRKDAKKLRYLIECFSSLFPDNHRKPFARKLKQLQDNLGEHQDAETHSAQLRRIAHDMHDCNASTETMLALGSLASRLDQRQSEARSKFAEQFAEYDSEATAGMLRRLLEAVAQ